MRPILGYFCTLDDLGYDYKQVDVMFMVLGSMIGQLGPGQVGEHQLRLLTAFHRTCHGQFSSQILTDSVIEEQMNLHKPFPVQINCCRCSSVRLQTEAVSHLTTSTKFFLVVHTNSCRQGLRLDAPDGGAGARLPALGRRAHARRAAQPVRTRRLRRVASRVRAAGHLPVQRARYT